MEKANKFIEEYNQTKRNVFDEENHSNFIILAHHSFRKTIHTSDQLEKAFILINDEEGNFVNMLYDHRVIFTNHVEDYVIINCGYDNNIKDALEPYLQLDRKRIVEETFKNMVNTN